jgi:NADPH-dependent 2,4-dienoyl-CoA reductase/sulfur reductase-like enzyme
MNRRAFLSLAAVTPLARLLPAMAAADPATGPASRPVPKELKADLVVVGGGVGGVACALAAARNGLRVILTEQYDWIGGQLTSQAVPPDEYPQVETFPCTRAYGTFRTKVADYYRTTTR